VLVKYIERADFKSMWNAIRSDLTEFVSSVADDSNTVLEKIDTTIKDLDKDDESNLGSSNDGGLSHLDTSGDISQDLDPTQLVAGDDYTGNNSTTGYEATGIISEPSDERTRRMGLEETYTVPLLKDELNGAKTEGVDTSMNSAASKAPCFEEEDDDENVEKEDETECDKVSDNVNTQPPDVEDVCDDDNANDDDDEKDVNNFLKSFDIQAQTEEISKTLTKHPDTVGLFFENLVPVVITYEQFWQRFFYRCDVQRIEQEWDDEEERVRLQRQEMIDKGVSSVKNMWGGALKAFQGAATQKQAAPKKASIYEKYQAEVEEQQRAMVDSGNTPIDSEVKESKRMGLSFFGSGRPPFAMNTAGSGDDDEEEYIADENSGNEEDEEDEEFGWGSDEEEESESEEEDEVTDDNESEANISEHEIVFGSTTETPSNVTEELERLREELAQVVNARDKLEVTVKNQSSDLAKLQNTDDSTDCNPIDHTREIESLKMSMFEKDAELAALKASLQDTHEDNARDGKSQATSKVPDQEIELMAAKLSAKDDEVNQLQSKLEMVASAIEQADSKLETTTSALNQANDKINSILAAEKDSRDKAMQNTAKVEELNKAIAEAKATTEAMQAAQISSEQTIKELTARISEDESSKQQELDNIVSNLKAELEATRAKLEQQENNFASNMAVEIEKIRGEKAQVAVTTAAVSPQTSTSSSIVNIVPQPVEKGVNSGTANEEDDWGDSWSEGDDS